MSYQHLNAAERSIILHCSQYGLSRREIARRLGRSAATIGRELRRGKPVWSGYYNRCLCAAPGSGASPSGAPLPPRRASQAGGGGVPFVVAGAGGGRSSG